MATLQMGIDARGAKQGAAEFNQAAKSIEQSATQSSQAVHRGYDAAWKKMVQFAGAAGGVYLLRRAILSVASATAESERASRDLAAALGETDVTQSRTVRTLQEYAAELQRVTIYDDDLIVSQMAYAKNLGVTTDRLEEAAEAAIGLAARYRMDLASAMQLVGRASMGQTDQLSRYGIVLDDSLSKGEKFEKLLKIGAESMSLAKAQTRDAAGAMAQLNNSWSDLKETIGTEFSPAVAQAFTSLTVLITENDRAIKDYISSFKEGMEVASKVKYVLPPYWAWTGYQAYKQIQEERDRIDRLKGPKITDQAAWERFQALRKGQPAPEEPGRVVEAPLGQAKLTSEQMKNVVDRARDAMEAVRHQDYLTRMERIESLKIYQQENATTLSQVAEANKMLDEEIRALERSRVNQMKVYQAEMRERLQNPELTNADYATRFTRATESDFETFWDPVIDGEKSASEAVDDFFRNLASNFAKMQAQKAMMQVWDAALGPLISSAASAAFGGLGGLFGGGAGTGVGKTFENPGAVFGAPSAFGNVFRNGRLVPMAGGVVLDSPTYFPLASGKIGMAGEAGPELGFVPLRRHGGRLGLDSPAPQPVTVMPTPVKVIVVANQKQAALEAQRSAEGQAVTISTLRENGLI